jgi:hypothetical protein
MAKINHHMQRALAGFLSAAIIWTPSAALAWKPSTHVSLAEVALRDALDDGRVTIWRVDPRTGLVVGRLGDYPVDPQILSALRAAPDRFRAGAVGPDAYPDIATGQQIIHPRVARNAAGVVTGSDAWLEHLWSRSYGEPMTSDAVRAFVSGYLVHAAGDIFAHSYVNHYSGGEFTFDPAANAARHLVLESYIGKRAPPEAHLPASIDGVEDFIYREMIDARPGTVLQDRLLIRGETRPLSIPWVFSSLRTRLEGEVASYDAGVAARSGLSRVWYRMAHGPKAEYSRRWIDDIDRGLKAWPEVSAEVAASVLYYREGIDTSRAKGALGEYARKHLWSMAGAPDDAVAAVYIPSQIARAILPEAIMEQLEALVEAPFEALLKATTSMNSDEWRDYLSNPELHFDRVMDRGTAQETAEAVSLKTFNHDQLRIEDDGYEHPDQRWSVDGFPPAFNTVQLTKLSFLAPDQLREIARELGGDLHTPVSPNVMLGWAGSLDATSQWRGGEGDSREAWFANPVIFSALFQPHFNAP